MSGEQESLIVENELRALEEVLQEYLSKSGMLIDMNPEGASYLKLSSDEIRRMTAEDLGIASVVLQQYAFHIQKMNNHEVMIINWCDTNIKRRVARFKTSVTYYNEKIQQVIYEDKFASKLADIKRASESRVDSLQYLSGTIKSYAETFLELQKTKRGKYDRQ